MKVAKTIQTMAEGDRSGLRLSHGPEWATEVVWIHEHLKAETVCGTNIGPVVYNDED